jgi:hypothetical protein
MALLNSCITQGTLSFINRYFHIKDDSELLVHFQRCFCLRLQVPTLNKANGQPETVACFWLRTCSA